MHLGILHTPFSHIPSQRPLCCPHNGNPSTQERFFPCKCEIHTGKRKICSWRSTMCPKKTTLCKVLVQPARQPRAFQLCSQQYINLTNTEGCDLLIQAEPNLTSKSWTGRADEQRRNASKRKKVNHQSHTQ